MPISALSYLGLAKEAVWGTPVTAAKWLPVKDMKPTDDIKMVLDEGKRGIAAKDFGAYQGTKLSNLEYGGDFFPDVAPYFLLAVLGADTVSGTGPYTHAFGLGSAPPSLTLQDFFGHSQERQYAGCRVSEVGLKFATDTGAVEWTAKLLGKASALVVKTTPTIGTTTPFLGWQAALSIGGTSAPGRLLAAEWSLKRTLKEVFGANNSQDPSTIYAGILEVTGKMTFDMPDETELQHYLTNDQPSVSVALTSGANSVTILTTKTAFEKATVDRSQEFVRVDAQIRGLYNATDAGPAKITVINSVATY